jgi:hypothetical protein
VRNFFGRRRSGRSRPGRGGSTRRGTSGGSMNQALSALVLVVLDHILLRLLGVL